MPSRSSGQAAGHDGRVCCGRPRDRSRRSNFLAGTFFKCSPTTASPLRSAHVFAHSLARWRAPQRLLSFDRLHLHHLINTPALQARFWPRMSPAKSMRTSCPIPTWPGSWPGTLQRLPTEILCRRLAISFGTRSLLPILETQLSSSFPI